MRYPERITIYLKSETLNNLDLCAEKLRIPRTVISRKAIESYLEFLINYEEKSQNAHAVYPRGFLITPKSPEKIATSSQKNTH